MQVTVSYSRTPIKLKFWRDFAAGLSLR